MHLDPPLPPRDPMPPSCLTRKRKRCTSMEIQVLDGASQDAMLAGRGIEDAEAAYRDNEDKFSMLQRAYDQIYDMYQREKARNIEQAELFDKLLEDQKVKTAVYSKATNELLEITLNEKSQFQEGSQAQEARIKELEKENALYRNELLMSRAKEHQADMLKQQRQGFLHRLFQSLSQMQIEEDNNSTAYTFLHQPTGLKFALEPVGDEVKYTVISLGSLIHVAPEFMREKSIKFSMDQASVFFRRIQAVACGR